MLSAKWTLFSAGPPYISYSNISLVLLLDAYIGFFGPSKFQTAHENCEVCMYLDGKCAVGPFIGPIITLGQQYPCICQFVPFAGHLLIYPWVKVFRINPEFKILRLTFHRKSASKC